jgi:hypothetical protein
MSEAPSAAQSTEIVEIVIQGLTEEGKAFRPSDWAERLCGVMSAFGGDHRMAYSPYVHPVTVDGTKCVVVDIRLERIEPMAYRFLINFAKENELRMRGGRIAERTRLAELRRAGGDADALSLSPAT